MKLLGSYINGNYRVAIYDDGTKVRANDLDKLVASKPESMDIKITNQCECGCPFCHENSKPDGLHGDILNIPFIDTMLPYTEMAIGGGNPLAHPQLVEFLSLLKKKNIIASMTVNQKHFIESQDVIKNLVDGKLIYGIGVSLTKVTDELIGLLKQYPNAVIHVINGVVSSVELEKLFDYNFKVLILGYKVFRRGEQYYCSGVEDKKSELKEFLPQMINRFSVVSFDNLAIKQLDVKRLLSEDQWNEFYMGDDGQFTMYVDMVNREFARSSVSTERFPIESNICGMFNKIRTQDVGKN